jgi:DNA-binding transcriptional ArsR family regulator
VDPFPDEVRRFLEGNIESVDQLEILRLLGEKPDTDWTATTLAAAVQASAAAVGSHLAALSGRGLLAAEQHGDVWVARYGPRTPELAGQLGRLLQLYRERPVSMIKLVYDRARDRLRHFADAFRLRKDGG